MVYCIDNKWFTLNQRDSEARKVKIGRNIDTDNKACSSTN